MTYNNYETFHRLTNSLSDYQISITQKYAFVIKYGIKYS